MPHKPSPRGAEAVQFVSTSLTVALKAQLRQWADANQENIMEHITSVVQRGYRVTCKEEDQGFSASMALLRLEGANKGLVLVERASSPERALLRLLWAHMEHYKAVWPREKTAQGDDW